MTTRTMAHALQYVTKSQLVKKTTNVKQKILILNINLYNKQSDSELPVTYFEYKWFKVLFFILNIKLAFFLINIYW